MDAHEHRPTDPTRVGDQPALRTASGTNWLLWGGVTTVLVAGVMVLMALRDPRVGWSALGIVLALFLVMVVVRFVVRAQRARLVALALLDLTLVLVGLAAVLVVLFGQS